MSNYVIWEYKSVPSAAVLQTLSGLSKQFRLRNAVPLLHEFPADVAFHMHPDHPNHLLLVDSMVNLNMIAVVSQRLQEFMAGNAGPHVEYLPVSIIDHKGRVASRSYFIAHPVGPVDCIDREASKFSEDDILPGNIDSFERLVIDESRVPDDRQFFRMKGFKDLALVRRDLAEKLTAEKFSGIGWREIADYPPK